MTSKTLIKLRKQISKGPQTSSAAPRAFKNIVPLLDKLEKNVHIGTKNEELYYKMYMHLFDIPYMYIVSYTYI